jgi:2-polyprenyl-3-methyl-5-hydroxy-6-metoxy-1,4-benzoquinol methylase
VSEARLSSTGVVHGNVYDKYRTTNPIARRLQVGFERAMDALLDRAGEPSSILEVGCGEGHVTARLAHRFPNARVVGADVSPEIVALARRRHPQLRFETWSVYDADPAAEPWDLVVACEVLEHLDDPERALSTIARLSRRHVFASVPREPWWRLMNLARGRYVSAGGNTPGHVQHWSRPGFLGLLGRHLEVVDTRSPWPWTQALARVRS